MFLKKTKEKNGGQSRWECFDEFWRDVSTFVSLMEGFLFILIYIYIYMDVCVLSILVCAALCLLPRSMSDCLRSSLWQPYVG